MSSHKDLCGTTFNKLVVTSLHGRKNGKIYWDCLCSCGKTTIVNTGNLRTGQVASCGCMNRRPKTHGMTRTRTYNTWSAMIARCENHKNKDYKYYGLRGIMVCKEWRSFELFMEEMGGRPEGMTIDRIDVNGNYERSNCRWASIETQSNNKRSARNIEFNGVVKTMSEWAKSIGITCGALHYRLSKHPVDVSLTKQKWRF